MSLDRIASLILIALAVICLAVGITILFRGDTKTGVGLIVVAITSFIEAKSK